MHRLRKAKIIATLGPASSTPSQIEQLFLAGADVFRINFSHGKKEDHFARIQTIRGIEAKYKHPIGILADLQGPKLRVGEFKSGRAELQTGQNFRFDLDSTPGNENRVCLPHPEIFAALTANTILLADDGKISFKVMECGPNFARTSVLNGGTLLPHKGVNLPGVILPISPITSKDREDLNFALDLGVDWVALSFVQKAADILELRELINGRAKIIAKLEKPLAVIPEALEDIVEVTDAVMVARGDLGVECPPEDVPPLQKRIIAACRSKGKPVVVATQMLESMNNAPTPTRAEASDVATAIYDGADTVMLSGETASGNYPIQAVTMMSRIIQRVEKDSLYQRHQVANYCAISGNVADAIGRATREVAHSLRVAAIVTFTSSGSTALRLAQERPEAAILGITTSTTTARALTLAWGIYPVVTPDEIHNSSEMTKTASLVAQKLEMAEPGDLLAIVAGVPFGTAGTTNLLRIHKV